VGNSNDSWKEYKQSGNRVKTSPYQQFTPSGLTWTHGVERVVGNQHKIFSRFVNKWY